MAAHATFALAGLVFALATLPSHAGPCTDDIYRTDEAINARLGAIASESKPAAESTFATLHRQPTPLTLAGAEAKAGDISDEAVKALREQMDEARKADAANDGPACEKALAEARDILKL